jgi:hypothetical protein
VEAFESSRNALALACSVQGQAAADAGTARLSLLLFLHAAHSDKAWPSVILVLVVSSKQKPTASERLYVRL